MRSNPRWPTGSGSTDACSHALQHHGRCNSQHMKDLFIPVHSSLTHRTGVVASIPRSTTPLAPLHDFGTS